MRILLVLSVAVFLNGCAAGKEIRIKPQEEYSRHSCGDYEIYPQSIFSDGFMVVYYLVPLLPWPNSSKTESSLEIPVQIINRVNSIQNLTLGDVAVRVSSGSDLVRPYSVDLFDEVSLPDKPYYHKSFRFTFDINRHDLHEFELVFSNELYECSIPEVPYIKVERFRFG